MVSRRHLPQRDHAPRRRRPAGALAARARALRPRALPAGRAQRGQLLAAGARRRRDGRCRRTSGARCCALAGDRRRARGPTPTSTRSTDFVAATSESPPGRRRDGRDAAERRRAASRASAPSACSTSCCAPGPTTLDARPTSRPAPARHRPRPACSPACPRCCARRAGKVELAPEPIVADVAAAARGAHGVAQRRGCADRPPPAALQQLVDAQPRRCSCTGRRAARCTCTPTTPRGSGSPTAPTRRVRSRRRRGRRAGRGHRRDHARRGLDPPRLGPRRRRATSMAVARAHAGVNSNLLTDERRARAAVGQRDPQRRAGGGGAG